MKKVTLLNFPVHLYELQKKTGNMSELFKLLDSKKKHNDEQTLAKLLDEKSKKETELKSIPDTPLSMDIPVIQEYLTKLNDLRKEYPETSWGAYRERGKQIIEAFQKKEPVELTLARRYQYLQWSLEQTNKEIEKVQAVLNERVPMLPAPLTQKHINLINKEIEKRALQGLELERYELLETTFYDKYDIWQKFYSGVLFTWYKKNQNNKTLPARGLPQR